MRAIDAPNFKLTGQIESPIDLDYDIYGLHKKKTLIAGELRTIEYFRNYDGSTYSDLVVKEERTYTRNSIGLVQYRNQVSTWYMEDDTIGVTKSGIKYYDVQSSFEENSKRRTNLLSDAKMYAASQLGLADALDLLTSVNNEVSLYTQGDQAVLIAAIGSSTKSYLTQGIKDAIISILTIS